MSCLNLFFKQSYNPFERDGIARDSEFRKLIKSSKINEKAEPRPNKKEDFKTNSENREIERTTPTISNVCLNTTETEAAKRSAKDTDRPSKTKSRQTPDDGYNINLKQEIKSQPMKNKEESPLQGN